MALTNVLSGLASINVIVGNITIPVQNADTRAMPRVRNSNFRYLLPLSTARSSSAKRTLGGGIMRTHKIEDMYIYRSVKDGSGLEGSLHALLAYMDVYAETIIASQPTASSNVIEVEMLPSVITYPTGSQTEYFGVRCQLTIEEYA